MTRFRAALSLVGVLLLATGCLGPSSVKEPTATGTLLVHTVLPAQIASSTTTVSLLLTKDKVERHTTVSGSDDTTVTLELPDLPVGVWDALLQLTDGSGNTLYEAKDKISVMPNVQNVAQLRLRPMPGSVKVFVDLASWNTLPGDDPDIVEVKLTLAPGGTTTAKVTPGDPEIILEKAGLEPSTVDFHLTLNIQGDKNPVVFYNTPKQPVTIWPGTETVVHWQAAKGDLEIVVDIDYFPDPPHDLIAQYVGDGTVSLQWQANTVDTTVTSYRIYERIDPFGDFKAIDDVPVPHTTWEGVAPPGTVSHTREYAVAAVNAHFQSVRTEPVAVNIPPIAAP